MYCPRLVFDPIRKRLTQDEARGSTPRPTMSSNSCYDDALGIKDRRLKGKWCLVKPHGFKADGGPSQCKEEDHRGCIGHASIKDH